MSEKDFSIPKMYKIEEGSDGRYARIVAEPFECGYGTTVGNALRRVLLSSLQGSAVRPFVLRMCCTSSPPFPASTKTPPMWC